MKKSIIIRTGRHCVFNIHIHLVFVTKYRRKVFNKTLLSDLKRIFSDVCEDFESQLIEFDGEKDHIHLLIHYPPKIAVSKLVNSLKGVSSRLLKKRHSNYLQQFLWKNNLWSPSYFTGSCGGAPIRKYIEQQQTPLQESLILK